MPEETLKDGVYIGPDANYYVKDAKIIMLLKAGVGGFYTAKTTFNSEWRRELTQAQIDTFDHNYSLLKPW